MCSLSTDIGVWKLVWGLQVCLHRLIMCIFAQY